MLEMILYKISINQVRHWKKCATKIRKVFKITYHEDNTERHFTPKGTFLIFPEFYQLLYHLKKLTIVKKLWAKEQSM